MRHFLDTQDFSKPELLAMIELAKLLKEADRQRCLPPLLAGASLGMIFEEPSTRTRISFEVAMTKLGGHAIYLKPGEIHLGVRESIKDTSKVISRMVDAIEARTLKHETVMALAQHATVAVINGLTDYNHPTQVLCDVMTMIEHKPAEKRLEDLKVTFIGDATNVCSSLLMICTQLGMHFTHCAPKRYQSPKAWQDIAKANCALSGGTMTISDDPKTAISDADFVYTDLWWWVGQEAEIPDRQAAFMPDYQVNEALFAKAPSHAKMMHCLPASRGVEATDGVLDHHRSIIYDQSENRLHMEKAILVTFIAPRLKRPEPEQKEWHAGQIAAFLSQPILAGDMS
jgi:putrescine carbamoyltransferase